MSIPPAQSHACPPAMARFTLSDLSVTLLVLLVIASILGGLLLPVLNKDRNHINRRPILCAGNLKKIGLALLMYTGDNGGFFPIANGNTGRNLEPLNAMGLLADGKVYGCPSASNAFTFCRFSNYRYRGSGLKDDNDSATAISVVYDQSGNHPDNQWLNALFIDGHVEGARPDGKKTWNLSD